MDESNRCMKMLFMVGLVVVALALGYSLGLRQKMNSPLEAMRSATMTPDTIRMLQDAQQRAHETGDVETEAWLRQCADEGRDQFFNWASAKAHGRNFSVARVNERHAASR